MGMGRHKVNYHLTKYQSKALKHVLKEQGLTYSLLAQKLGYTGSSPVASICHVINGYLGLSRAAAQKWYDCLGRPQDVQFLELIANGKPVPNPDRSNPHQINLSYIPYRLAITRQEGAYFRHKILHLQEIYRRSSTEERQELLGKLEDLITQYKGSKR